LVKECYLKESLDFAALHTRPNDWTNAAAIAMIYEIFANVKLRAPLDYGWLGVAALYMSFNYKGRSYLIHQWWDDLDLNFHLWAQADELTAEDRKNITKETMEKYRLLALEPAEMICEWYEKQLKLMDDARKWARDNPVHVETRADRMAKLAERYYQADRGSQVVAN
jgi:hypothetical protein